MQVLPAKRQEQNLQKGIRLGSQNSEHIFESNNFETKKSNLYRAVVINQNFIPCVESTNNKN